VRAEPVEKALLGVAERALPHWGLAGASLEPHAVSENVVYRVESPGGERFALRIHREGYHTLPELESEALWTAALAEAGIDVPEALPTKDGCYYARVPGPGEDEARNVGLVRWIDGVTLEQFMEGGDAAQVDGYFERLGTLLAGMHEQSRDWTPPAGFTRHAFDAEGLLGDAPFWGRFWESHLASAPQRERLRVVRDALRPELDALRTTPEHFGMIHADLRPANLIVDGERLFVIDFDDAGFGWHAFDVAVSLQDFLFAGDDGTAALEALLRGYRAQRDPGPAFHGHVERFELMRALMIVGWVTDRPEVGVDDRVPPLVVEALRRAEALGLG
jgi:Ser/Thr protein kinase RdoA (MazF antagonist)